MQQSPAQLFGKDCADGNERRRRTRQSRTNLPFGWLVADAWLAWRYGSSRILVHLRCVEFELWFSYSCSCKTCQTKCSHLNIQYTSCRQTDESVRGAQQAVAFFGRDRGAEAHRSLLAHHASVGLLCAAGSVADGAGRSALVPLAI